MLILKVLVIKFNIQRHHRKYFFFSTFKGRTVWLELRIELNM